MSDAVELATGYVSLAVSTEGLGKEIARQFGGIEKVAADTGKASGAALTKSFVAAGPQAIEQIQKRTAAAVKRSADLVKSSQTAAADATRKVGIEEAKLLELRESGKAKSSQILTVEDRLEKARRSQAAATRSVESATREYQQEQDRANRELKEAERAADAAGKSYRTLGQRIKDTVTGVGKKSFSGIADEAGRSGTQAGAKFGGGFEGGLKKLVGGAAVLLAGVGIKDFVSESISLNSDLNESLNKSSVIFGDNAKAVEDWAGNSAKSLGLAKGETIAATSALGDLFSQIGFTGDAAAKMSTSTVQAAADLGSFSNLETGDVLERINAALIGEYDSLQKVIPNISAARVEQQALAESGVESAKSLTAQQKAHAVLSIIQEDGVRAMGDFAKTSGGLANQQKILAAETDDLKAAVGERLVPALAEGLGHVTDFLDEMKTGQGAGGEVARTIREVADAGEDLGGALKTVLLPTLKIVGGLLGGTVFSSATSVKVALGGVLTILAARKATGFADSLGLVADRLQVIDGRAGRVGGQLGKVAGGLGKTASVLGGPWGIAAATGVTLLASFASKQDEADKATKDFTDTLTFQNGVLDENSAASLRKKLADEGTLDAVLKAGLTEADYTAALLGGSDARAAMIAQLDAIQKAHTTASAAEADNLGSTDAVGQAAFDAAEKFKTLGANLETTARHQEQASNATNKSKTAIEDYRDSVAGTAGDMQKLIDKFTILRDGALDQARANDAFESSLDSVRDTVKSNAAALGLSKDKTDAQNDAIRRASKSLSENTDAGRNNRESIRSMVSSLNDKVTADVKAKGSTEGAAKAIRNGRGDILRAADAAGLNKREVKKMIDQMVKTPKELKTEVSAPGVDSTTNKVDTLRKTILKIDGKKVTITYSSNAEKFAKAYKLGLTLNSGEHDSAGRARGGLVPKRRGGGVILAGPGAGGPRDDLIAGIDRATGRHIVDVSPTEMVVNARQTARNIRQLRTINAGGDWDVVPRRADGGQINRFIKVTGGGQVQLPDFGQLSNRLALRLGNKLGSGLGAKLDKARDAYGGEGGPIGKGGYVRALNWLRRNEGHPYVYATIWDCSGVVGAAHSIVKGESPHRRYATPTFQGDHAGGFTRGKRSPLMIAVNPAPGKSGHMVGQINGVPFEEAGGIGLRVGSNARRLSNPMFSWRGGLAAGGQIPTSVRKYGDLPFDLIDPRGERYNPLFAKLLKLSGYADGTSNASPGLHWVGEKEPEVVWRKSIRDFKGGEEVTPLSKLGGPGLVIQGGVHGHNAHDVALEIEEQRRRRQALEPSY